jgi:putative transposase
VSAFIDAHRDRFGVEPICTVLQFAPSTYYAYKARSSSTRDLRDAALCVQIQRAFTANYSVYGADKIWRQLQREGVVVARCTVERLMREMGIKGTTRGKPRRTTIPADVGPQPKDHVDRDFTATAPNRLWVADLTYIRSQAQFLYAALIIDCFSRMIVGWQIATHLRADLALDALEMAVWLRRDEDLEGVIHHTDRGVQYVGVRYTERLAEIGAVASVGSRGDSYDNALAETTVGLYKTELVHPRGPWKGVGDLSLATFEYVDWFNHRRLHGAIGMIPPAEFEANYYRALATTSVAGQIQ